ncbi:MAG: OmpA family protein [Deltaproteobacteria bacterium]|nr:OmpA family protein [Deltaproteobacteria bacterium]
MNQIGLAVILVFIASFVSFAGTTANPASGDISASDNIRAADKMNEIKRNSTVEDSRSMSKEYKDLSTGGGYFGETGLWRVTSAEPLKSLGLRLNIHGEWFYFKEFLIKDDTTQRQVGDLSFGIVPYDNLEIFALYQTISTYNDKMVPKLQLSQGNISLGLKYAYPVLKYLSTGAAAIFTLNTKPGDSTYSLDATGYTLKSVTTFDAKSLGIDFLRLHLNLGAYLIGDEPFGKDFNVYSHYLLNMNEQKQFLFGFGVDFPLRKEGLLPFVEVSFGYPDGPGYASGGIKYQPFEKFDLTFDLITEFGIFRGTPRYAPTTQHYNIVAGLSYGIKPSYEVKVVKEKVIEKVCDESCRKGPPPAETGFAKGFVYEEGTETAIGNAIVVMEGTGLTNLATDPVYGDFTTPPINPGKYNFSVFKEGYEPSMTMVEIKKNEKSIVKVYLRKKVVDGTLTVNVVDSKGGRISDAEIIAISGEKQIEIKKNQEGIYTVKLPAGKWYVVAKAENKLSSGKIVEIQINDNTSAELQLRDKPKETLIIVEKDRITLKKKIQFAKNSAKIMGNSTIILDMVADAINSNPRIKKVRIEGHTDDTGNREKNIRLSQERADAVKDYLIKQGIRSEILEAVGYGPDKPISSNKTAKGREQNRRVEFVIEE